MKAMEYVYLIWDNLHMSIFYAHTHTHTYTRSHTHTHTQTHNACMQLQTMSSDDPLGVLLKDFPAPNEDNLKNNTVVKLDLIQTREHLGLSEDLIGVRVCL